MAECIEREATIKRIKEVYCAGCNSYNGVRCRACGTGDAIDMIEDAPAADVAPIEALERLRDELYEQDLITCLLYTSNKRFGLNAYYAGKHWSQRKKDAEELHELAHWACLLYTSRCV